VSDKVRYKEENDLLRFDKDQLATKMVVLDKMVRQNEQMLRDKYMIEGGKEAGEMSEEDKLKLMLYNSDKDLTDKKNQVAELSVEVAALKVDLREANESVRVLSDRVEEILKSEDSLNDQLESSEKARREEMRRMSALEEELVRNIYFVC
jgi:chromosome segregation ATPase